MGMMLRWRLLLLDLVHQAGVSAVVKVTGYDCVSMLIWLEWCDFSRTMKQQASEQHGSLWLGKRDGELWPKSGKQQCTRLLYSIEGYSELQRSRPLIHHL